MRIPTLTLIGSIALGLAGVTPLAAQSDANPTVGVTTGETGATATTPPATLSADLERANALRAPRRRRCTTSRRSGSRRRGCTRAPRGS
jgi:hypothetical protein